MRDRKGPTEADGSDGADGREDDAFPPVVTCATCKRPDCAGCSDTDAVLAGASEIAYRLAWEGVGGSMSQRLWATALATSTEPRRVFGKLPVGGLAPALGFAFLTETLALASLGIAGSLAGYAIAPGIVGAMLTSPPVLMLLAVGLFGSTATMVALHALWGACIELGARRSGVRAEWRHGMRFGLYACGWDLITSPAGVVQGLVSRGPFRAWAPLSAAAKVPRIAMRAYIEDCRHLDRNGHRGAVRVSVVVLGGVVFLIASAVLAVAIYFATISG